MKRNEGELYLQSYPKLRKWINECQICHAKGYKPDMPKHIANLPVYLVAAARVKYHSDFWIHCSLV